MQRFFFLFFRVFLFPLFRENQFRVIMAILGVGLGVAVFIGVRSASFSAKDAMGRLTQSLSPSADLRVSYGRNGLDEKLLFQVKKIQGVKTVRPVLSTRTRMKNKTLNTPFDTVLVLGLDLLQLEELESSLSFGSSLIESKNGHNESNDLKDQVGHDGMSMDETDGKDKNLSLKSLENGENKRIEEPTESPFYQESHEQSYQQFRLEDFFVLPNRLIASASFLEEYGLSVGSSVILVSSRGESEFQIQAQISKGAYSQERLLILDIFAFQYQFQKPERIDWIDVILSESLDMKAKKNEVRKTIQETIGSEYRVETPLEYSQNTDAIYRSFQMNLTVVSLIALLVGMYLIFNTIHSSISSQRKEMGVLRSLGLTPKELIGILSCQGFLLGFLGSILGVVLGYFLSLLSVEGFANKLNGGFLLKQGEGIQLQFPFSLVVLGFSMGWGMSGAISFFASLGSLKLPIRSALHFSGYQETKHVRIYRYLWLGILLLFLGYLSSRIQTTLWNVPIFGFLSSILLILGFSFCVPFSISFLWKRVLQKIFIRYFAFRLAFENLVRSLGRTAITVSSWMVSITLILSLSTLIQSYHVSITNWFSQVNNADISIFSGSQYSEGELFPMKEDQIRGIETIEGVKAIDPQRFYSSSYRGKILSLHSFRLSVVKEYVRYTFLEGNSDSAFSLLQKKEAVLISESIASKNALRLGDKIRLKTDRGNRDFLVAGIVLNYLSSQGVVSIPRKLFRKYWRDDHVDIFKVYVDPNLSFRTFQKDFREKVRNSDSLIIQRQKDFQAQVLSAVDDTFLFFHALEWITIFIAVLGLSSSLFASVYERRRQIGILRALGSTPQKIGQLIYFEGLGIGFLGSIFGVVAGFVLSLVTVFVLNQQTVGWYLEYSLPWKLYLLVFPASIFLAVLSAYFPAWKSSQLKVRENLQYE